MSEVAVMDLERQRRALRQARASFAVYAEKYLKIRTKSAGIQPFKLNEAQIRFLEARQAQLDKRGFVRMLVPKARQLGISTLIEGIAYYRVTGEFGYRAFILTHLQQATDNLFGMTRRFHEKMDPSLRPHTGAANAKTLWFDKLDSSYVVSTAGNQVGTGRSDTVQFFHGSEVAMWPNAEEHATGVMSAIAEGPGTEIYLESTGRGPGDWYHGQVMLALKGLSNYEVFFAPWYWAAEYRTQPVEGFERSLNQNDTDYAAAHGLDLAQMQFRANKIALFGGGEEGLIRFEQEYPATLEEAFRANDANSFIKAMSVLRARRSKVDVGYGPIMWGVDPSWLGGDRFVIKARQGRKQWPVASWHKKDAEWSFARVMELLRNPPDGRKPDIVYFDYLGVGAPVFDRLKAQDLGSTQLVGVNAGAQADDPERFYNKRAEMLSRVKDWLNEMPYPQVEDSDELMADLCAARRVPDPRNRVKLESKDDMAKRGIDSPDSADALALTFAYPPLPSEGELQGRRDFSSRPVQW